MFEDDVIEDDKSKNNYREGKKGKTTYELHSTRRVMLDREVKRLKMRTIINDIKNSLAEKKEEQLNKLSANQQRNLKLKQTQQKILKDKQFSLNIPQNQLTEKLLNSNSNSNRKLNSERV